MADGDYNYQAAKSSTITTTGNIDNLDVDGAGMLILNNASTATIRGIDAGYHGQLLGIISIGAGTVEIAHQDTNSSAANRIVTSIGTTHLLAAGSGSALLQYDATSARWRVLDNASVGTWTVTIGGAGGESGQVYSSQVAHYVKIGPFVTATFGVTLSTLGSITGQVQIEGLPFASLNVSGYRNVVPIFWIGTATAFVLVQGTVVDNSTVVSLFGATAATTNMAGTALVQADLNNTTRFVGQVNYRTNS